MKPVAVPNPSVRIELLANSPDTHVVSAQDIVLTSGLAYRLFVARPLASAPDEGFPALYLLDGNAAFAAITADSLSRYPGLAVIGIGFQTDTGLDFDARSRDYTPAPLSGSGLPPGSRRPKRPCGGAADFLAALTGEIIPFLEARIGIDPCRRTLWGHSYGGLFALHALAHGPCPFQRLSIASPTLWWDGGRIVEDLAGRADRAPVQVDLSRGGAERSSDTDAAEADERFARLERVLRGMPDLVLSTRTFAGAGHREMLDLSLPCALALAAG